MAPIYLHLYRNAPLIHRLCEKNEERLHALCVRITHIWITVSYFDNGSTDGRKRRQFARVITVQIPAQVLQLCVKARPPGIRPCCSCWAWAHHSPAARQYQDANSQWKQRELSIYRNSSVTSAALLKWGGSLYALLLQSNENSSSISTWYFHRLWDSETL